MFCEKKIFRIFLQLDLYLTTITPNIIKTPFTLHNIIVYYLLEYQEIIALINYKKFVRYILILKINNFFYKIPLFPMAPTSMFVAAFFVKAPPIFDGLGGINAGGGDILCSFV